MPTYLLLADDVSRDAIDDAIAALRLQLVNLVAESASHPRQIVCGTEDAQITFLDDARLGARCVVLDGPAAQSLAAALGAHLPLLGWDAIEARLGSDDPADRVWAIGHGAALRDIGRASTLIGPGLADDDRRVRRAALIAAAYLPCPDVADLVRAHTSREPDAELAALTRHLAPALEAT